MAQQPVPLGEHPPPAPATTTRAGSSETTTSDSSGVNRATPGGDSSLTNSRDTTKSTLSTGAIAGIIGGVALIIIGIALIAGGVWWGFKKGQKMGQERQVVVENIVPAAEDTVGGHRGNGGGAPGTREVAGAGGNEKPAETIHAADVHGTDGRRVEMQA